MQLQDLKEKFYRCRQATELHEKREKLMEQIEILKESLDQERLDHHRHQKQTSLEEKEHHLEALIRELRSFDHILDETDHEDLETIQRQLIAQILETNPKSKDTYLAIETERQTLTREMATLSQKREIVLPFFHALKEGEVARRRRGFLNTLFGRNAQVTLARAIHKASQEAEKALPKLKDPAFREFLEDFLHEAQKSWNRPLYRDRYFELHDTFAEMMDTLNKHIARLEKQLAENTQALDRWIAQH